MANMLNKETWEYLLSQNTRKYDGLSDWVVNPDMSEVVGHPTSHWDRVEGGMVKLKTAAQITAIDAVPVGLAQDVMCEVLKREVTKLVTAAYPPERVASLVEILDDAIVSQLTNRAAHIRSKSVWTMAVFAFYAQHVAAIKALTDGDAVLAYSWDLADITAVDPKVSVSTAFAIGD